MPLRRVRPLQPIEGDEGKVGVILQPELYGAVLGILRRRYRLRQVALARDLDWPQSLLSKVERGDVNITIEQLEAFADGLDRADRQIRGDKALGWQTWQVAELVNEIRQSFSQDRYVLVWSTGRAFEAGEGVTVLRGEELNQEIEARWPESARDRL